MKDNTIKQIAEKGFQPTILLQQEFEQWKEEKLWNEFLEEKMNQITVTVNKINALDLKLQNGQAKTEYNQSIEIPANTVSDADLEGLPADCGLTISKELTQNGSLRFTVSGKSDTMQNLELTLRYKHIGYRTGDPINSRKLSFVINADPKDLWQNIPTPEDIEYYKPDQDMDFIAVEEENGAKIKNVIAASMRGRSHAHVGKPRDDDFKITYDDESNWYVMAVADGAGSAKFSRRGSEIACNDVTSFCIDRLKSNQDLEQYVKMYIENPTDVSQNAIGSMLYKILGNAALLAHKAIKNEAELNENAVLKDYATTLLLAICKKIEDKWFIGTFWVGDGALALYTKKEEGSTIKMLGAPDEGEFAGQTRFLTMPEIFNDSKSFYGRLRFSISDDFTALMLMTDGVSDAKFETDANLQNTDKWDELWDDINTNVDMNDDNRPEEKLQEWLNFWSPGNHDDRTIAILY